MAVTKLNLLTGRLETVNGSFVTATRLEEIAQNIWLELSTVLGEVKYDTERGMPFAGEIFAAGTPAERIQSIYRDKITSRPGVLGLIPVDGDNVGPILVYDAEDRELSVTFRALTVEGELSFAGNVPVDSLPEDQ